MKPVVVLGDLVMDYTLAVERLPIRAGEHQYVSTIQTSPGGAANTLIMGARLGLPMQAVGTVGKDEAGHALQQALQTQQIDTSNIALEDVSTPVVYCLTAPDGQHVFLGHISKPAQDALRSSWAQAIQNASALFFDGWNYRGGHQRASVEAADVAASHHVPVFFDVGPDYQNFDADWVAQVLARTHTLFATEDELRGLLQAAEEEPLEVTARRALQRGVQRVIVKQGVSGCSMVSDEGVEHHAGYTVAVQDTTGAGDALAAAVIYAHLHGFSSSDTLALANAAGATAVTRLGAGLNLPTKEEVLILLKTAGKEALLNKEG